MKEGCGAALRETGRMSDTARMGDKGIREKVR
jgi:hypothetical protein